MELGVNFINAVKVLADERNLSEEEIFASVEEALALTYKKCDHLRRLQGHR